MAMITASIKATDFEVDESYREVLFLFLPEVVDNLNEIAERLKPADMVAVAGFEQFNEFVATLKRYSKFANVRNLSIVLSKIIFEMNKQIEEALLPEEEWVSMSSIIGRCGVLPASVAKPLKKRIAAIKKKYNLNKSQGWRVFSILLGEEGEEDGKTNEI
jgi:hypothetical protein